MAEQRQGLRAPREICTVPSRSDGASMGVRLLWLPDCCSEKDALDAMNSHTSRQLVQGGQCWDSAE